MVVRRRESSSRVVASGWDAMLCRQGDNGIEMRKLDAGIGGGEAPVHRRLGAGASRFPGRHLPGQGGGVGNAPVETLTAEEGEFALRHVQPTAMLGGVVQFQAVQEAAGFDGGERLIQGAAHMGVQVIEHQANLDRVRIVAIDQVADGVRPVLLRPVRGDLQMAPPSQRLEEDEEVGHPQAHILVVHPGYLARSRRHGHPHLAHQLLAQLVHAHLGIGRVIGLGVHVEHVLHGADKLPAGRGGQTPFLLQPRLHVVFFSTWRTVSWETCSTYASSTIFCANSRSVQRAAPSGAALQASVTRCASATPSTSGRRVRGRGRGHRAAASPSSTKRWRTRCTVAALTSTAWLIAASSQTGSPSRTSALSRMRAWARVRAARLPTAIMSCNSARSSAVKVTMYFLFMAPPPDAPSARASWRGYYSRDNFAICA